MVGAAGALRPRRLLATPIVATLLVAPIWVTLLAAGADALAQSLVVAGSCRDGAPNGAFELRTRDGRLRIQGAFARGRRTGTFLFWSAAGARIALIPYDDDAKTGTVALWHAPANPGGDPRRRLESAYTAGVLHGQTRSWHANGKRRTEYRYERGELTAASAWSASGAPLPDEAAHRLAERDRADDAAVFANLERSVAEHAPRCE